MKVNGFIVIIIVALIGFAGIWWGGERAAVRESIKATQAAETAEATVHSIQASQVETSAPESTRPEVSQEIVPTEISQEKTEQNVNWITCEGDSVNFYPHNFNNSGLAICSFHIPEGSFVIGTANLLDDDLDKSPEETPCKVILYTGPLERTFHIWYGGGDYYPPGPAYSDEFRSQILEQKEQEMLGYEDCAKRGVQRIDFFQDTEE